MPHQAELQQGLKTLCDWAFMLSVIQENDAEQEAELSLIANQISLLANDLLAKVDER